jgi:hypothetical protein
MHQDAYWEASESAITLPILIAHPVNLQAIVGEAYTDSLRFHPIYEVFISAQ